MRILMVLKMFNNVQEKRNLIRLMPAYRMQPTEKTMLLDLSIVAQFENDPNNENPQKIKLSHYRLFHIPGWHIFYYNHQLFTTNFFTNHQQPTTNYLPLRRE